MDKLNELLSRCKCGVHIDVNEHRDYYESVEEHVDYAAEIDPGTLSEMIKRDTVIRCQFYPDTPIGFYVVWHYDLDACLTACLAILLTNPPPRLN